MSEVAFEKPVENSVPQINEEVAVGEDLEFQRRWWKFESAMWWLIAVLLLLNFAGVFGRGPAAHATLSNEAMLIKYERVERTGTPSILEVQFRPDTFKKGQVKLYVSQSVVDELGAQRVIPSPSDTAIGRGGLTYTFSANEAPAAVQFALQPSSPAYIASACRYLEQRRFQLASSSCPNKRTRRKRVFTMINAIAGYFFLMLTVRLLTRRPGAQMTMFEFVIVFLIGGVIILATTGGDRSITNCGMAILTVGLLHNIVAWVKARSPKFGALVDGTPLVLLKDGAWVDEVMKGMKMAPDDIMAAARMKGVNSIFDVQYAILERNGTISIIKARKDEA